MTNKALGFSNYGPALVEHCLLEAGLSTTAKTKGTRHFPHIKKNIYIYICIYATVHHNIEPIDPLRTEA
jgi:hypothetical protein